MKYVLAVVAAATLLSGCVYDPYYGGRGYYGGGYYSSRGGSGGYYGYRQPSYGYGGYYRDRDYDGYYRRY
jgi:hypothetical protein